MEKKFAYANQPLAPVIPDTNPLAISIGLCIFN